MLTGRCRSGFSRDAIEPGIGKSKASRLKPLPQVQRFVTHAFTRFVHAGDRREAQSSRPMPDGRCRSPLAGDAVGESGIGRSKASPASGLLQVLFVMMLVFSGFTHAQAIEPMAFANHAQEVRFQHLTHELRCPMCQNESLADSNAPIARDLRNQIFKMMQQGKSDDQIKQYLVDRYSDYVLYDPPLSGGTWLLWFGPLLILLGGAGVVLIALKKRSRRDVDNADSSIHTLPTDNEDDW
jgi:cytochrome c-type biogenesis protein CcmH